MRFLTFQVYVDTTDGSEGGLSLNNLYLELLDDKDVQKAALTHQALTAQRMARSKW